MCFSATASFGAAAGLAIVSVLSLSVCIKHNKRYFPLCLLSLFFAIQQFAEGMIWINSPMLSARFWALLFLFFAFFIYPGYISVGTYYVTHQPKLRSMIKWIGILGFIYGAVLFINVLLTPHTSLIQCHTRIFYDVKLLGRYQVNIFLANYIFAPLYVFFTAAPFFISDEKHMNWIGFLVVISSILSFWFYQKHFVSVWCFYSAVIALAIFVIAWINYYRHPHH